MIKPGTIQEIFETAKIDEVVGDFVSLRKRGINLIGLCPFHNEKTPSFTVSPAKGIYKCFGCGKGGNAVNFIMEHEHYTYPEALKFLAKKYSIEVDEEEQTPEQIQQQTAMEGLYQVSAYAQKPTSQIFIWRSLPSEIWEKTDVEILEDIADYAEFCANIFIAKENDMIIGFAVLNRPHGYWYFRNCVVAKQFAGGVQKELINNSLSCQRIFI